ncbi:MAG: hypothetical protein O3C60_02190 [Planctomycetota bacterium]|nr:hypothetical protein [Planctomycetota bacterium]
MNIRIDYYDEQEVTHLGKSLEHGRKSQPVAARNGATSTRRGKAPVQVNGIHRRRRRKLAW